MPHGWRRDLVRRAKEIAADVTAQARAGERPPLPRWGAEELRRFHPHVALELFALRARVMRTPDDDPQGQALRLCLSSLLVKLMRSGPEAPRDGWEKRIARGMPSRLFAERAEELAAASGRAGAGDAGGDPSRRGQPGRRPGVPGHPLTFRRPRALVPSLRGRVRLCRAARRALPLAGAAARRPAQLAAGRPAERNGGRA